MKRSTSARTPGAQKTVVMRPLGPPRPVDLNGKSKSVPTAPLVPKLPPKDDDLPSSSASGPSRGLVVTSAPLKNYMPAVRSAAAQIASEMATTRNLPASSITIDAEASPVVSTARRDFPLDVDFKWSSENYSAIQRTIDTWSFFTVFRVRLWLLEQKWSYPGGFTEEKRKDRARSLAKYLLESVLDLGPTFIKLGQLGSTRSDLFPAEFVEELSNLQDRVPAFRSEQAVAYIEAELGRPIRELFRSFDMKPIAAASLGQVHRAVLMTGEEVVVKVQRPGLRNLFDIDLGNMKILCEQLDKGDENRDFKGIYQECAQVLYQEIDYINEGRNADRFRRNFRDVPWVAAPIVHWEYCSPRILTLEYLPGIKISDRKALEAAGLEASVISRRATESYLIQILKHGFFHADPHPGNVAVDASNPESGGRLVYYDFGMMGEISGNIRETLLDMFYAIYRKNTAGVISALVELGVIRPSGDMLSVRRSIAYFLDNIARQAERKETVAAIGEDLFAIAIDQPFRFPATFTFVLRAFSTLEGIGKSLDPEYNFATVAQPYAQELLDLQVPVEDLVAQVRENATRVASATAAMPDRIARVASTIEALEAGDIRLRVRVLEAERSARRTGILQVATLQSVAGLGIANIGTQLAIAHLDTPALVSFHIAGVFAAFVVAGLKRVERLDKFEKDIRG